MNNQLMQFTMEFRDQVSKELEGVKKNLESLDGATGKVAKGGEDAAKGIGKTGTESKKTGGLLKGAIGTAAKFAGALGAIGLVAKAVSFGKSVLAEGMEFEETMSGVRAMTGATGDDFKALSDEARRLGATTSKSAQDAAEAQTLLAQSGFSVGEILEANEDILYLSIAANIDMAQAADIAAGAMNGFGLEAKDMSKVTDILAKGAISAATDVEGLGAGLSYVAPTANAMGKSIEETTAALALLADANIKGSRGGTSLNNVFAQLGDSSSTAVKELSKMGISYDKLDPKTNTFAETLGHLNDANFESSDAMRIFGQAAGPAMAVLLEQGQDGLESLTKELENSEGAAKGLSEVMADNLKGDIDGLSSAWSEVKLSLYEGVAGDVLRPFVQGVTKFVEGVPGFLTGVQSMFKSVFSFGEGGTSIFGKVTQFFKDKIVELQPVFEILSTIFMQAKDVVVEALTTLWGIAQPVLSSLWNIISSVGGVLFDVFVGVALPVIQLLWTHFQNMWAIVQPILTLLGEVINIAFTILEVAWVNIVAPFISFLSGAFATAFEAAKPLIEGVGTAFDFVGGVIEKVSGWFSTFTSALSKFKVPNWLSKLGGGGTVKFEGGADGSHATGLARVPFDNYNSLLHKNESVLTANQSDHLRGMGVLQDGGGGRPVLNTSPLRSTVVGGATTSSSSVSNKSEKVVNFSPTINVTESSNPQNTAKLVRDELYKLINQTAAVTGM